MHSSEQSIQLTATLRSQTYALLDTKAALIIPVHIRVTIAAAGEYEAAAAAPHVRQQALRFPHISIYLRMCTGWDLALRSNTLGPGGYNLIPRPYTNCYQKG